MLCPDLIQFDLFNHSASRAVALFPKFFSDSHFFPKTCVAKPPPKRFPVHDNTQHSLILELEILQDVLFDGLTVPKVQELKQIRNQAASKPQYMHSMMEALAEECKQEFSFAVFITDFPKHCRKDCAEPHCVVECEDFENVSVYADGTAISQSLDYATALEFMIALHFLCNLENRTECLNIKNFIQIEIFLIARM